EVFERALFAGMGDVESVEPKVAAGFQQFADLGRYASQSGQIDWAIQVAEALGLRLVFVHRRGQRGVDALPDQSDEEGLVTSTHVCPPLRQFLHSAAAYRDPPDWPFLSVRCGRCAQRRSRPG